MYGMGELCDVKGMDTAARRRDEDSVRVVQGCCGEFLNIIYGYHCSGYDSPSSAFGINGDSSILEPDQPQLERGS